MGIAVSCRCLLAMIVGSAALVSAAIGVNVLPGNIIPVEIELIVE